MKIMPATYEQALSEFKRNAQSALEKLNGAYETDVQAKLAYEYSYWIKQIESLQGYPYRQNGVTLMTNPNQQREPNPDSLRMKIPNSANQWTAEQPPISSGSIIPIQIMETINAYAKAHARHEATEAQRDYALKRMEMAFSDWRNLNGYKTLQS